MSEFKELVKTFSKTREYVRDFFIYGFKTRDEFTDKSPRTYDNERRRIESWLSPFIRRDYTLKGKNISLAIDSNLLETNPLYTVWKSKSFTDNDIMLHFFILNFLITSNDVSASYTAEEITNGILIHYDVLFDNQAVRRKCNNYAAEGLLLKNKYGKDIKYSIHSNPKDIIYHNPDILSAIKYYQLVSPMGILGSTIMDNINITNNIFRVKHNFFVHTLEDEVLVDILYAIHHKYKVSFHCKTNKKDTKHIETCIPIQIFTSTRTGRRFVCSYRDNTQRFFFIRLDHIKSVNLLSGIAEYDTISKHLDHNRSKLWGVSFQNNSNIRIDHVKLTLYIHEATEQYILRRLEREGKSGIITHISENIYTYDITVYDGNEMLPWIRTFIGRIISIDSNNTALISTFNYDMRKLYSMYDLPLGQPANFNITD